MHLGQEPGTSCWFIFKAGLGDGLGIMNLVGGPTALVAVPTIFIVAIPGVGYNG